MIYRLCSESRCASPATYRGRCQRHQRARNRETHRNREVYNSAKWRHTRKQKLAATPLCERCGEIAEDVHHKVDLSDGGDPWALDGLESLCHSCHARVGRRRQRAAVGEGFS